MADPAAGKAAALAGEAERLSRAGRAQAATPLWDQVLALVPDHAGALNHLGALALARGDTAAARTLLQRAIAGRPASALAHANYARLLLADGDHAGALRELDRALKLEPAAYAAHFEKAAIYGRLGRTKDQALAYESALQVLPPAVAQSAEAQPLLEQAQRAVLANKAELGRFLDARLATLRSGVSARALGRFDESLDVSLGRKPVHVQKPAMFHVPGLPAIAFFEREDFAWAPAVEASTAAIRAELEAVLAQDDAGFVPYVQTRADEAPGQFAALDRNPDWSAYFLWHHGRRVDEHVVRCPATMAMLEGVPQVEVLNRAPAAFFSALKPHTRIPPHTGATNCRLTVHLPLVIPPHCALQVGNHVRAWTPGELLIFDDTIEHAAWNDSDQLRVVLIFDVWHPLLSDTERALVKESLEGIMAFYGHDAPLGEL
jgi:aspartate beta-hydroxylase